MPYTQLATATVGTMKTSLEALAKEIETLKKDKKADKKKVADLEKQYKLKNQNLAAKFLADIKIAETGVNTLALAIEKALTEAATNLKALQTAAASYKNTRLQADHIHIENSSGRLKELAQFVNQEMDAFAASWDCYRAFNPGGDPKLAADGNAIRTKIMDLTKVCRGKANKVVAANQESETLLAAVANLGNASPAANQAESEALYTRLETMSKVITTGKLNIDAIIPNTENMKMWVDAPIKDLKISITTITSQYSHCSKAMQDWIATLGSMQKVLAAGKASIDQRSLADPKVASALKKSEDLVTHLNTQINTAKPYIPQMAQLLTKAQARLKAGK